MTHCFADVCDWNIRGLHLLCIAMLIDAVRGLNGRMEAFRAGYITCEDDTVIIDVNECSRACRDAGLKGKKK